MNRKLAFEQKNLHAPKIQQIESKLAEIQKLQHELGREIADIAMAIDSPFHAGKILVSMHDLPMRVDIRRFLSTSGYFSLIPSQ